MLADAPLPVRGAAARPSPALERVVVLNDVSVARGGATSVALTSARLLRDSGLPVTFITGDAGAGAALPGAELVPVGGRHIRTAPLTSLVSGLYNRAAAATVAGWIAANDTPGTVYHLHGWSKILSPAVFRALAPVSARLVVSAHDFFLVCPNGGYFDFRAAQPCELAPMGGACVMRRCDRRNHAHKLWRVLRQRVRQALVDLGGTGVGAVAAVHEGMLPHLARGGIAPRLLTVLRNPVMPWQAARVPAENNRVFVFVGRLEADKGADLLARAARRAGVPVRLIGDGPLAALIAEQFPEVERRGWQSAAGIAEAIADARALVMPSRYREPFGLVAIEALMSGLPVVVSEYAMLAPELAAAGLGLACDPHDEAALAALLARLAGDDALVAAMSRRAFAEARGLAPTPAAWAEDLTALYRRVLARSAAA